VKRQPSEWEKIIANEATDKQLISKIYKQLQYSCLKSPMDRGAWWAIVQRATKSQTQLSNYVCRHIVSPYVSIVTLNVDGLNFPIKRHGVTK